MPISELTPKPIRKPRTRSVVRRPRIIKKDIWTPIEPTKTVTLKKFSWGKILWGASILFVFFIVISLIIINRDLPTPEGLARRVVPQSTKIYDRTGKILLYDIHGAERRTSVPLSQIPHTLKLATLAAEDRTFYEHSGFRFTSMIRSVLVNILRGSKVQGGSTITQQLIKNAILGSKKTYARKVRELILAYQIEKFFSKEEILQLYFNEIPYASNAYGAEAGAQVVFGKPVNNLNLAESAILASLPKATTYYSPWGTHRDDLIKRQHYVLDAMTELGQITKPEAEEAKQFKLEFKERRESITAPHFVFYVREILTERYGEKLVNEGGLKVITTLDVTAQTQAETAIKKSYDKNLKYGATNASLVALDVPTSQILAMVGSVDYFDDKNDGQVNVALRSRQPGSSFKPIAYTAAFALGFKPETILFDVETTFKTDTKDYTPHNYDGKERGPISLRQALAGSLNIPAVKLLYLTGIDRVLELAKSLGYTTLDDRSRFGLSLVLGGAEVKLLEHINSFTTLARDGIYKTPTSILKVEDDKGKTLEEYKENSGIEVLNSNVARATTSVLSDNQARSFIFGSSNHLTLPNRPVAAKTGTTNDYRDAWTLGYTPQIATGVWVGNNNNKEMKKGADGSVVAAPIWQNFMTEINKDKPVVNFIPPTTISTNKPILNGILGQEVVIDSLTGKLATDSTPPEFKINKIFPSYHTILNTVVPGAPLGEAPENPARDPQFNNWETAIQNWARKQNLFDEAPPIDFDDVHKPEFAPQLKITSPTFNQLITSENILIQLEASAVRGNLKIINFWLDGNIIELNKNFTPTTQLNLPRGTNNGFHDLKIEVVDEYGNKNSAAIMLNILLPQKNTESIIYFKNLKTNDILTSNSEPLKINFGLKNPDLVNQIDFFAKTNNQSATWIGVTNNQSDYIVWNKPPLGIYDLFLVATLTDGTKSNSEVIKIQIK